MAWDGHHMLAPWNNLFHANGAKHITIILILPTWKILHQMPTLEYPVFLENIDIALVRARITTTFCTWVCAPFTWSRARLQAENGVMKDARVAFLHTCMSTWETFVATQITASFGGEP